MFSKILFFIATLCIVNAYVNTLYDADGLSIFADTVNEESGNFDLNLHEDVEDSFMGGAGLKLDSVNLPNEERIRICSSSICKRVCRVLKLKGKCVKKRCKCLLKDLSITADTVNDEYENFGLNFNEDVEESPIGIAGQKLDSAESPSEERIRICNSNICNRVCRIVNLKGKCAKKRCRCLPRALSMLEEAGFMVNEEVENPNLITEE